MGRRRGGLFSTPRQRPRRGRLQGLSRGSARKRGVAHRNSGYTSRMRFVDLIVRLGARRSKARSRLLAYRVLQSIMVAERAPTRR
jgi:hypothetical protein